MTPPICRLKGRFIRTPASSTFARTFVVVPIVAARALTASCALFIATFAWVSCVCASVRAGATAATAVVAVAMVDVAVSIAVCATAIVAVAVSDWETSVAIAVAT